MKKLILSFVLLLALLLVLPACGEPSDTTADTEPPLEPCYDLAFRYNQRNDTYSASIGSCTCRDLVIPEEYEGKPVVGFAPIRDDDLSKYENIVSITFPKTATDFRIYFLPNLETITVATDNPAFHSNGNCVIHTENKTLVAGCQNSIIPDDGSVTSIGYSAFYGCTSLADITIPSSVTSIDHYAFSGCTNLSRISIGKGVLSIGDYAFQNCTSLTDISFHTVGEELTFGRSVFENSGNVSHITVGKEASYIDWIFWIPRNESLTVTVEEGNPLFHVAGNCLIETASKTLLFGCDNSVIPSDGSVTRIDSYAFSGCTSLVSVTIPDSVTSIGDSAFSGCTSLASITVPSSVTSIGEGAFSGCTSLAGITLPEKIAMMGHRAFEETLYFNDSNNWDNGLLYLGNWLIATNSDLVQGDVTIKDSTVGICPQAFYHCSSLVSVVIPNGITHIGSNSFQSCDNLVSVIIPDSVTTIEGGAFSDNASLTEIAIPSSVTSIGGDAFSGNDSLTKILIPNSVTSIEYNAFSGNENLTEITIPSSVTSIGEYAFSGNTSLTKITLPSSVTSIGEGAFSQCRLAKFTVEQGNAFYHVANNCLIDTKNKILIVGGYNSIIPDDGSVVRIGNSAFAQSAFDNNTILCEEITIPQGITSIGNNAFAFSDRIKSIVLPSGLSVIESDAFTHCDELIKIKIPDSVTELGQSAFLFCRSLRSVTLSNSLTEIKGTTFRGCTSLALITIPDSVTMIGFNAFEGCQNLTTVTLGKDLTKVEDDVFENCQKLSTVNFGGTVEEWNALLGKAKPDLASGVTVRCTDGNIVIE